MKRRNVLRIPALMAALALLGCMKPEERVISSQRKPSWKNADDEALTAAKDLPPPEIHPETHVAAAKLFEGQGNVGQAMVQYRKALMLDAGCVEAHGHLGLLLGKIGRHADAEAELQTAVKLRPRSATLRNNLGYEYMLQERWPDAEAELRNAIQLQPDYRRAHVNLGVVLCKLGLFDDGLAEFEAVLSEGDAFYNLGLMYRAAGRYRAALDAFAYTLKIAPGMSAARVQLSRLATRVPETDVPQPVGDQPVAAAPAPASPASIGYVPGTDAASIPEVETELAVQPMMLTGAELDSSSDASLADEVSVDAGVPPISSSEIVASDAPVDALEEAAPAEPIRMEPEPAAPAAIEPAPEPPLIPIMPGEIASPEASETALAELPNESLAPIVTSDAVVTPDAIDELDTDVAPEDVPGDDRAALIEAPDDVAIAPDATDTPAAVMTPWNIQDEQPDSAAALDVQDAPADALLQPEATEPVASDSPEPPDQVFAAMVKMEPVDVPGDGIASSDGSSTTEEPVGPALAMVDLRSPPWTELAAGTETDEPLPAGDDPSADSLRVQEDVLGDWWLSFTQSGQSIWTAMQVWLDKCVTDLPAAAATGEMDRPDEPPVESMPLILTPESVVIEGDLAGAAEPGSRAQQPIAEPDSP